MCLFMWHVQYMCDRHVYHHSKGHMPPLQGPQCKGHIPPWLTLVACSSSTSMGMYLGAKGMCWDPLMLSFL